MKLKYILIIIGSMLLLIGLLSIVTLEPSSRYLHSDPSIYFIISVIGLGTLLTGIFWKKQ